MIKLKYIFLFSILVVFFYKGKGQSVLTGEVSYLSGENVYLKFNYTSQIKIGDTIYEDSGKSTPCLQVIAKSSISCVSKPLNNCQKKIGDRVFYFPEEEEIIVTTIAPQKDTIQSKNDSSLVPIKETSRFPIKGRFSVAAYMNHSNFQKENITRVVTRLALSSKPKPEGPWSFDSYLTYTQNIRSYSHESGENNTLFRVYALSATYENKGKNKLMLGRSINQKLWSIGSFDGVQYQHHIKGFYLGGLAGFKPDIFDFSFNPNLFQYGVYAGYQSQNKWKNETTIGFVDQYNGGISDRRYFTFQHSMTPLKNFLVFASADLDILEANRLTAFYLSTSYRLNSKWSFFLSFDSRKQVIFFESNKTALERLLADDFSRQGFRSRVNYQISRNWSIGLGYSKRFQKDGNNPSDNLNLFITYRNIPLIGGRLMLNGNANKGLDLSSMMGAARYSHYIFKGKGEISMYYRFLNYEYMTIDLSLPSQHYGGVSLSKNFRNQISLSALGEWSTFREEELWRFNIYLSKRF